MSQRFAGKKIVVTGASSGIGRACALRLASEGAIVIALGRNEAAIRDALPAAHVYLADITNEADLKELARRLRSEQGCIDGCVLAAGLHTVRPLATETFDQIQRPWSVNVQGCLGLLALLLKGRMIAKGGSVVLFSSASASVASPCAVAYAASKGAIEAATLSLAIELVPYGVRVNAVSPGVVTTPMSVELLSKLPSAAAANLEARHPMGFGKPEDIAGPVSFLLSDDARWITGVILRVDGGYAIA